MWSCIPFLYCTLTVLLAVSLAYWNWGLVLYPFYTAVQPWFVYPPSVTYYLGSSSLHNSCLRVETTKMSIIWYCIILNKVQRKILIGKTLKDIDFLNIWWKIFWWMATIFYCNVFRNWWVKFWWSGWKASKFCTIRYIVLYDTVKYNNGKGVDYYHSSLGNIHCLNICGQLKKWKYSFYHWMNREGELFSI